MISKEFYIELGKLLYAIATVDGSISEKETKVLDQFIHQDLNHKKYNALAGKEEILLTKASFYNCHKENATVNDLLQSYKTFLQKYGTRLETNLKMLGATLLQKIASTHKGMSLREKQIINELAEMHSSS